MDSPTAETTGPSERDRLKATSEAVQVVIFASEGVTRSVMLRPRAGDQPPCVVVDYDEAQDRQKIDAFEAALLGQTREQIDNEALYIL